MQPQILQYNYKGVDCQVFELLSYFYHHWTGYHLDLTSGSEIYLSISASNHVNEKNSGGLREDAGTFCVLSGVVVL